MALIHRIRAVKDLLYDIQSVTTGDRSGNRFALADVYEMTLNTDSYFPTKPISLLSTVPANLRRKVSNTCPLCISESKMNSIVDSAKRTLLEYKPTLQKWLQDNDIELDSEGNAILPNVNELDSNLKTL